MPHQVLERLGVHAGFCHVAAVGMAADMGCDVRHLHPVDIIVPLDHVVETVFPMHGYFRVAILVCEQESRIAIHHPLAFRFFPVLNDCPEALCHILRHGQFPCSGIRFGRFNDQSHVGSPLQLVVDIDIACGVHALCDLV